MNPYECPKCGERMEEKFSLPELEPDDSGDYGPPMVYQCPKCKNVEMVL